MNRHIQHGKIYTKIGDTTYWLRTEHTGLTYRYFLNKNPPPICDICFTYIRMSISLRNVKNINLQENGLNFSVNSLLDNSRYPKLIIFLQETYLTSILRKNKKKFLYGVPLAVEIVHGTLNKKKKKNKKDGRKKTKRTDSNIPLYNKVFKYDVFK